MRAGQSCDREMAGKTTALAGGTANVQARIMFVQGVLDDREPKPCTAAFTIAAGVNPIEALC
jgi:hypothetical protein